MTVRGKANAWKRVLSCFLVLTLIIGTLTFTGNEAKVVHAANGTISITQTEAAWYSLRDRHVNFQYSLTGTKFSSSFNIINEDFIDQYISFAGGMTKADFMEGLTYGGIADVTYFQINWGNRTRKFESGWSFTIAQGAPITYNGSSATVTLDREYTFTFADGGANCDNYCTPQGYYTNTFKLTMNATFGDGKTGTLTNISFDSSTFRERKADFTTLVNGNEEYRDYIAFSKVNFADYTEKNMKINYLIHGSYGAVQITEWGDIRDLFGNGDQLIFYKGFPVYYTDSAGNACKGLLDHTYVFECIGSNRENDQVFRYMPLDENVPMYGLKTGTKETVPQSDTNLEQYINVPFAADCQKADAGSFDAMNETVAEQYIELSGYTFEEAKNLGIAIRFIPNASVLQLGFSTDTVSALPVGTTLTLKKGMPIAYDLNQKLNAVILDSDYIFTLTKNDGTKLTWNYTMHATYALWQKTIAQGEEGNYKMYAMPIVTDAFPDMKAINDHNNRGQGRFNASAWNYLKLSHHSIEDLTNDVAHLDWYGYHPEMIPYYQGLRLYSNLTFADGETMTLKKGLPITYTTTDERTKVITLEKDVIWKWVQAENTWVITDKEAANVRNFELMDIQDYSQANDNTSTWQIYLTPSNPLSDDNTENWYGNGQEYYPVKVSVGEGEPVEVQAKQNSPKSFFIEIPYTVLAKDATTTLTVRAGEYKSSMRDKYWKLNEDYKLYINKYGWSETGYITGTDEVIFSTLLSEHSNSKENVGFTFGLETEDDACISEWNMEDQLQPIATKKVTDTTLYWALEQSGLYIDGTFVSDVNAKMYKLDKNSYYVPLSDFSKSGEEGKTYQVKGYYLDKNGKIFHYESPVVKWTGEKWETVIEGLADTGVRFDINADESFDSKDLVRLLKYMKQPHKYKVTLNYVDCNFDGVSDSKDIGALRRLLLKTFWYDIDTIPYGTPVFDEELTVERLAYACPSVTKEDGTIFTDEEVDAVFREFKKTGLTLLNTEFVAPLSDQAVGHETNDALRAYLRGAERNGLGVIVNSVYLETLLACTEDIDEKHTQWKNIMDDYVSYLKNFPAFRGFIVGDEIKPNKTENYREITRYLKEKYPELILFTSQLPTYEASFYKSTLFGEKFDESLYKNYIDDVGPISGYFTYDNYALLCDKEKDGDYKVLDSWYTNLKLVANNSVDVNGNQKYIPGVVIQSCGTNYSNEQRRYAPEQKEDIGFQMYTALAWGMQSINYFAYGVHPDSSNEGLAGEMMENPLVKASVTAANSDLATFDHVYKSFKWQETLDVAANKTVKPTKNTRLSSAKATGGRAFVGCMQDVYGFDGYMVANAEGPRSGKTSTVTLTLHKATKAWVYYNGTKEKVELNSKDDDYTYEKALKAGEGMFVIPIR